LIFAEKITDHHHAYKRRSEINYMNLINGTAKVGAVISKNFSVISIMCRILNVWRSIELVIKHQKFLKKQG
jgi:hypothetical protein